MSRPKQNIVYPELEAEIARQGIRKQDIATFLDITPRTLSGKLSGIHEFTLTEALHIHAEWFAQISFTELFKRK